MIATHSQLIQGALSPGDVVYTPDWCARDMVSYFEPRGKVLEPCKGDGAIYKYLPVGAEWCEIELGRDFLSWDKSADWIITNPPYSTKLFIEFLNHSFRLSDNVVFLVPTNKIFQSWSVMDRISLYGGIKAILVYGGGNSIGFPFGFSVGAFHFQRSYAGDTKIRFRKK